MHTVLFLVHTRTRFYARHPETTQTPETYFDKKKNSVL